MRDNLDFKFCEKISWQKNLALFRHLDKIQCEWALPLDQLKFVG